MRNPFRLARDAAMEAATSALERAATLEEVVAALRTSARTIIGADGITVVRRFGNEVAYVDEDAISPLWTGRRFPIGMCVSGMAMLQCQPIVISDIGQDKRVPMNAYLGTFVRSMAMFPIGDADPHMAMGAYWSEARPIAPAALVKMTKLAGLAGDAVARIEGLEPNRAVA
jgi:hypothetical protein